MKNVFNISFPVVVSGFTIFVLTKEKPWGIPFIMAIAILSLLFMYNMLSLRKIPLIERQRFAASFCFAALVAFITLLAGKQLEAAAYAAYSLMLASAMCTILYRAPLDNGYDRIFSLIPGAIIVCIGYLKFPLSLWVAITFGALVSIWLYWVEQKLALSWIDTD